MDATWITLREWVARREQPPTYATVLRYAREEMFQPRAEQVDGTYRVSPDATVVMPNGSRGRARGNNPRL